MNVSFLKKIVVSVLTLTFLSACGGGDSSSVGGNSNGGQTITQHFQAKKIVVIYNSITSQSCSSQKLKKSLTDVFFDRGYIPTNYSAKTGRSLNCNAFGENCETVTVNEKGSTNSDQCIVGFDLDSSNQRFDQRFLSKNVVLLFNKLSPESCVHSEVKSELQNIFLAKGYQTANIITQPVESNLNCNPFVENGCMRLQGEDQNALDGDQCLIGFDLPVAGHQGGSSDPFMKRNTVFIYSNLSPESCKSRNTKNYLINSLGKDGYSVNDLILQPIDYSSNCNAYSDKGCTIVNANEPGADVSDRCLVGINLSKSRRSTAGGKDPELKAAIVDYINTMHMIWMFDNVRLGM